MFPAAFPYLHSRRPIFSLARGWMWGGMVDWARFRVRPFRWHLQSHLRRGWTCYRGWGVRGFRGKWFWLSYVNFCFLISSLTMYKSIGCHFSMSPLTGTSPEFLRSKNLSRISSSSGEHNTYKLHIEKLLTSSTFKGLDVQTNEQISPPTV